MIPPEVAIVEAVGPNQLEQVRALFQSYQSGLPARLRFPDSEWQSLPGAYSSPGGALLLARVDAQPVGCVGLRPFPIADTCEMKRLYVAPSFRGYNLGSILIECILQAGRRLGYAHMRLDTHLSTMGAAVELYRRFGFVEVPSDPMPKVEGLTYMQLNL